MPRDVKKVAVSIRYQLYKQLSEHCDRMGCDIAATVEQAITKHIRATPVRKKIHSRTQVEPAQSAYEAKPFWAEDHNEFEIRRRAIEELTQLKEQLFKLDPSSKNWQCMYHDVRVIEDRFGLPPTIDVTNLHPKEKP